MPKGLPAKIKPSKFTQKMTYGSIYGGIWPVLTLSDEKSANFKPKVPLSPLASILRSMMLTEWHSNFRLYPKILSENKSAVVSDSLLL